MLEKYFTKPETVDRLRSSWIGEPIERYVIWLNENGYADRNIHHRVPVLRQFGEFAKNCGAVTWEELPFHIETFVEYWVSDHAKNPEQASKWVANNARTPVDQMLTLILPDFKGKGRSRNTPDPFKDQVPGFFLFLREERGLRTNTVQSYCHYLQCLEDYLNRITLSHLKDLTPVVLSAFIIENGRRLSKNSMTSLCSILRVFLRYLYQEQLTHRDLSATIEVPMTYQLNDTPRSISWEDVNRMFDLVDRRTELGKRDYAILLLLVTYGLRSHEVAALTLDHIDWERERLLVPARKADHTTAYPLSSIVGDAIVDYLEHGRPETAERNVFFRVLAPRVALTSNALSNRATHYLRKAGIQVRRPGSHTLRHTCVQRLVDADFSFKVIGDYMGHASPSSTKIYTKIDVEALREVAMGHGEELT
jgi:site-specific recombinase XerD